jgi:hypothetical protein
MYLEKIKSDYSIYVVSESRDILQACGLRCCPLIGSLLVLVHETLRNLMRRRSLLW